DNRIWISFSEAYACFSQHHIRCCPWRVDELIGQLRNLGHPLAHIMAQRIKALALRYRIENPEIGRGIEPAPSHPWPVSGVIRAVSIKETVPEPLFAHSPI